jgi:hypothetical protein
MNGNESCEVEPRTGRNETDRTHVADCGTPERVHPSHGHGHIDCVPVAVIDEREAIIDAIGVLRESDVRDEDRSPQRSCMARGNDLRASSRMMLPWLRCRGRLWGRCLRYSLRRRGRPHEMTDDGEANDQDQEAADRPDEPAPPLPTRPISMRPTRTRARRLVLQQAGVRAVPDAADGPRLGAPAVYRGRS